MRKGEKDSLFNKICYHLQEIIKIKHLVIRLTIYFGIILLLMFISSNTYSFSPKEWDLKIRGTINETYDDNTTFIKDDKKEDIITRLTLDLEGKYGGGTRVLGFSSRIAQSIFANEHNNNNLSGDFNLNFLNELSKYHRIILSDTFTRTFVPSTFEDEFGRTKGRYKSYHNTFNLAYSRDISKKLTIRTGYINEMDKVSKEGRGNSYQNSVGLSTSYIHSAVTALSLSYRFAKRRYEDATDTSTHTLAAGMKRYITKRIYFDGSVGTDFIKSIEDKDVTSGYFKALLTDEIYKNAVAKLSFTKRRRATSGTGEFFDSWQTSALLTGKISNTVAGISFVKGKETSSDKENIFESWRTSGSLTREFKRFSCSFSGFYGEGTYTSSDITEKLKGISVAFGYEFTKDLKGDLKYSFSDKSSTDEDKAYTKNMVSSGLTLVF